MDRFTHYALAASIMAVKDANLTITEEIALRTGVWIGSGIGGMETYENQFRIIPRKRRTSSKSIFRTNDDSRYGCWPSFHSLWCKSD